MEVINFNDYSIRTIEHAGETWYSCIDVIASLTESNNPSAYWRKLKQRLSEKGSEVVTKNLAKKDNLRDNCSDLELTFITLAKTITKELAEKLDARGFRQNQDVLVKNLNNI